MRKRVKARPHWAGESTSLLEPLLEDFVSFLALLLHLSFALVLLVLVVVLALAHAGEALRVLGGGRRKRGQNLSCGRPRKTTRFL